MSRLDPMPLFLQEFLAETLDFNTLVLGQGPTYRSVTVRIYTEICPQGSPQGRREQILPKDELECK